MGTVLDTDGGDGCTTQGASMPLTWTLEMVTTVSFVLSFYQKKQKQKQKNRPKGLGRTMVSQKGVGHSACVPMSAYARLPVITYALLTHLCPLVCGPSAGPLCLERSRASGRHPESQGPPPATGTARSPREAPESLSGVTSSPDKGRPGQRPGSPSLDRQLEPRSQCLRAPR